METCENCKLLEMKIEYLSINLLDIINKLEEFYGKAELNYTYIKKLNKELEPFKNHLNDRLNNITANDIAY